MRHILLIFLIISAHSTADENPLDGLWKALDNAHRSIYGYIEISGDTVRWGNDVDLDPAFPCSAKIVLVSEEGSWDASTDSNGISRTTKAYRIRLENKQCDYDSVDNSDIHKMVSYFQMTFTIPDNKNSFTFSDFNEDQQWMGEGTFFRSPN